MSDKRRSSQKELTFPFEIPAEAIALPTRGATVRACTYFHAGEKEPEPMAQLYGLPLPADLYRYDGEIHPVDPDAPEIRFSVAVPVEWNGKLIQSGGSGINGFIPPFCLPPHGQDRGALAVLKQGYAVFGSDSGHQITNGDLTDCRWILNRECFENFAHLSLKKTKDAAAYLIRELFGTDPERVYFYGGSNGGRECIKAIQNYPDGYDGAVCFYPVLYWILKILKDSEYALCVERAGAAGRLSAEDCARVAAAAAELCGVTDGALKGVITDWRGAKGRRADVKAAVKKLVSAEQFEVLTEMEKPYAVSFPLAFGETVLPGYEVFAGADVSQHIQMLPQTSGKSLSEIIVANVLTGDTEYDTHTFRPEDWRERILAVSEWMDAYGTGLDTFVNQGKKLILVQGTVDPLVTMDGTIRYYERLKERYGEERTDAFLRFYVAPGYGHGADGPFQITADFAGMLDNWVERGIAPEEITVTDVREGTAGRTQVLPVYR